MDNTSDLNGVRLAQAVAAHAYGVSFEDLNAPTRGDTQTARARHVAMYLAHIRLKRALRTVAQVFGRDHKAVLHACRRIEAAREDPKFDRTIEWLEGLLRRACEVPA